LKVKKVSNKKTKLRNSCPRSLPSSLQKKLQYSRLKIITKVIKEKANIQLLI
jgi:hypothetical protein